MRRHGVLLYCEVCERVFVASAGNWQHTLKDALEHCAEIHPTVTRGWFVNLGPTSLVKKKA
jgi:hypothetical protein